MPKTLALLVAKLCCLCNDSEIDDYASLQSSPPEKSFFEYHADPQSITADEAVHEAVEKLMMSEKSGRTLQIAIDDIVARAGGWSQAIAYKVVKLLEYAIEKGISMGNPMKAAYDKSLDAVEKLTTFVKDHPFLCTLVVLGILAILAPTVILALGFTAEGVIEGSVAASWQSTYGGYIEAGSLFSYLQKLGTVVGMAEL